MLELKNVKKVYDTAPGSEPLVVLDGVELKLEPGQLIAVSGNSGCGKSTLLNIIGALDKPASGQVKLNSQNLADLNEKQLAEIRNKNVGFIFQFHHLIPQCTVIENVLIPVIADNRKDFPAKKKRAAELLEMMAIKDFDDYRPGQLSGGQRQRVAVARALINSPNLVLADEPTGSLDAHASETVTKLLIDTCKKQKTAVIVVTHSEKLANKMNKVYHLSDGKLTEREPS